MEAAQILIRKERGLISVHAMGRTGRGQKYIKGTRVLTVSSISDKKYKKELAQAVKELIGSDA